MKIENSVFNFPFLEAKIILLNLVFNKNFEIQVTLNLKNKFPSENS